jgi:rhodanese-related sulfurtransferase
MPRSPLAEALLVVALGAGLGLAANALSPRGLSLTRNYFPDTPSSAPPASRSAGVAVTPSTPDPAPAAVAAPPRTKRGLPLVDHARVTALFRDPRHAQGLILFVDARNEEAYRQGHIPGAHLLDHYHLERHLADLVAPAHLAQEIVVYCNGGECEDSDLAAHDLIQLGVPPAKIVVYAGGIADWKARREPLEVGARGSGEHRAP